MAHMRTRKSSASMKLRSYRERGLTLIETALVLGIMALFSVLVMTQLAENNARIVAAATADKMTEVAEASKGYIDANYAALLAAAPAAPNGALVIPAGRPAAGAAIPGGPAGLPSLQGGGFLSSSFIDRNAFNQRHALLVRRCGCAENYVESMVTTYGGRDIPDSQLGSIANMIGASGGYVPQVQVVAADNGQVVGSFGGWRTPINQWGPAATRPSVGTLQATMVFEDGTLLADYLYRNDIGIPEANRMSTSIDMDTNDIDNLTELTGVAGANPGIGGDTVRVAGNLRTTIDVWADRDVRARRDVIATRDVEAGSNVVAGLNVASGRDTLVGRDLDVTRNAQIDGFLNVSGNAEVDGNQLVRGTFTGMGDGTFRNDLTVDRTLDTGAINLDAVAYERTSEGGIRNLNQSAGIRLGDLLPRMVAQFSYRVRDGQVVFKPTCRGGFSRARIMVYRQTESYRVTPDVRLSKRYGTIAGYGALLDVTQDVGQSKVDIANAIVASDNGSSWTVNWIGDPSSPNGVRQAIAQTFCFYG